MALWQYQAGRPPHTITVYERKEGGTLYIRVWDAGTKRYRKSSLGHSNKKLAQDAADAAAGKLAVRKDEQVVERRVTLSEVFTLYLQHQTPNKSKAHQGYDKRRVEMWTRFLGGALDPQKITPAHWQRFIRERSTGAIDATGRPVQEGKRKPVRARGVGIDCQWLHAVMQWASEWQREDGSYLLRSNPVRGSQFPIPTEKNPRRPIATADRYDAIRAVSDEHMMELRWTGSRKNKGRSYISELLDIVAGTGRRISAVCALRFDDLRLERTAEAPHGAIRWPADTDKMGYESVVPISAGVRTAVDRILAERPTIGSAPVFPSPTDLSKPIDRYIATKWLREVETMAGLDPLPGGAWHPYRRKWATERKHLPAADVAAAGGWKCVDTLKLYQQVDAGTMLRVIDNPVELREAK